MDTNSDNYPKLDVQVSPPYTNDSLVEQIFSAIKHGEYEDPIVYLRVSEKELSYSWEDLRNKDGPLSIQFPLYVYANKFTPLKPLETPFRILFTTSAQEAPVEQSIFAQLKQAYGALADPIVELSCDRNKLLNRLREKPFHIWHHKGVILRENEVKIELADQLVPLRPLLKRHASVSALFLQTRESIPNISEVPLLLTLSMDLLPKQVATLLNGFYQRLFTHSLEVAVFLARLDEYIENSSTIWKDFTLRGNSASTDLLTGERRIFPWMEKTRKSKVLFLKANPRDTAWLGIDHEFKYVRDFSHIVRSNVFDFAFEPAVQTSEIQGLLDKHEPEVLHFSGHGSKAGYLRFEADADGLFTDLISGEALVEILKHHVPKLKCVVLNSCWSEEIAKPIADCIECVIGMRSGISDIGAKQFSRQFYTALANGKSVGKSFERARDYLLTVSEKLEIIDERVIPQLLHRVGSDPYQMYIKRQ